MPPKPRIKIPVHVAVYTIAFLPGAAYAYYWYKNVPSDEEFEEELRKNYSQNINNSRAKHAQMASFLQNMSDPNNEQQEKMRQVLMGGKGTQNRVHAVDEGIYGTEEGAKLQEEAQRNSAKKGKRKKKKKEGGDKDDAEKLQKERDLALDDLPESVQAKKMIVAVAVAGAITAGASLFLGGKRS
jgi:hypothetical protein